MAHGLSLRGMYGGQALPFSAEGDLDSTQPNKVTLLLPGAYRGWVTSLQVMEELRRYCDSFLCFLSCRKVYSSQVPTLRVHEVLMASSGCYGSGTVGSPAAHSPRGLGCIGSGIQWKLHCTGLEMHGEVTEMKNFASRPTLLDAHSLDASCQCTQTVSAKSGQRPLLQPPAQQCTRRFTTQKP